MHLTYLTLAFLSCLCLSSLVSAQDVLVNLPDMGTLKGITKSTLGNMGNPKKTYYSFRNIPFAESVAGDKRFSQPVMNRQTIGTQAAPYDATQSGPLCQQLGLSHDTIENLNSQKIEDLIDQILIDLGLTDLITTASVVVLLEDLLLTPIGDGTTVGDFFINVFDVNLDVAEDCLVLSVYTPIEPSQVATSEPLPVMFFIYGGGFSAGISARMGYERMGDVNDVILVTVNYRLGPFGFLCLDSENAAGNMGLLDQIVGLEWVQENIQYFGGDPSKVTIFGQSAGGASVGLLTISPITQGLFHQAIGQSGAAVSPWAYDDETQEFHARKIAEKVGCTQPDLEALISCLKTVDATALSAADDAWSDEQSIIGQGYSFGGHQPCGQTKGARKVLEHGQDPLQILESNSYPPIPMFFGAMIDEGLLPLHLADELFFNETIKNDADFLTNELVCYLYRKVGYEIDDPTCNIIRDEYFTPEQLGDYQAMVPGLMDLGGALFLKDPTYVTIENNYRVANSFQYSMERRDTKSFHRIFDQLGTPNLTEPELLKTFAAHSDDLLYLFEIPIPILLCDLGELFGAMANEFVACLAQTGGDVAAAEKCVTAPDGNFKQQWGDCVDGHLTDDQLVLADAMVRAWTDFAIYGTPTPAGSPLPQMQPWTPSNPNYIQFGETIEVKQNYRLTYHSTPQRKN